MAQIEREYSQIRNQEKGIFAKKTEIIEFYDNLEEPKYFYAMIEHPYTKIESSNLLGIFIQERSEILRCIHNLRDNFNDSDERQISFVELKSALINFRNELSLSNQSLLRCVNMCIDSLDNTRSEFITRNQVEMLESVLSIANESSDDLEINLLQEILIKAGLKPITNLEGIDELYNTSDDYESE